MSPAQNTSPTADATQAKLGDVLTIDFKGMINGVAFDGGTASDFNLTLGSKQFIDGFEAQLVGAKAGDEKVVTVTFPAHYPSAEVAGKEATFIVKVKKIQSQELSAAGTPENPVKALEEMMQLYQAAEIKKQELYSQVDQIVKTQLTPAEEAFSRDKRTYDLSRLAGSAVAGVVAAFFARDLSLLTKLAAIASGSIAGNIVMRLPLTGLAKKMEIESQNIANTKANAIGLFNQAQQLQEVQQEIEAHGKSYAEQAIASAPTPNSEPAVRFADKITKSPGITDLAALSNVATSHAAAVQSAAEAETASKLR